MQQSSACVLGPAPSFVNDDVRWRRLGGGKRGTYVNDITGWAAIVFPEHLLQRVQALFFRALVVEDAVAFAVGPKPESVVRLLERLSKLERMT